MTKRLMGIVVALALPLWGCGAEETASGSDGQQHEHGGDGNTEHDHYAPGMSRESAEGLYRVTFYSDPAPPAVGPNVFNIGITRVVDDEPVEGAVVTVEPSMPDHGHGSDMVPEVAEEGAGVYEVSNVSLQMMGVWQILIDIQESEPELQSDQVIFRFDVQ